MRSEFRTSGRHHMCTPPTVPPGLTEPSAAPCRARSSGSIAQCTHRARIEIRQPHSRRRDGAGRGRGPSGQITQCGLPSAAHPHDTARHGNYVRPARSLQTCPQAQARRAAFAPGLSTSVEPQPCPCHVAWAWTQARHGLRSAKKLNAHLRKPDTLQNAATPCLSQHSRESSCFALWRQGAARTPAYHEHCDEGCTLPNAGRGGWTSRACSAGKQMMPGWRQSCAHSCTQALRGSDKETCMLRFRF